MTSGDESILRSNVPDCYKNMPSAIGAIQNYIGDLEQGILLEFPFMMQNQNFVDLIQGIIYVAKPDSGQAGMSLTGEEVELLADHFKRLILIQEKLNENETE